MYPLLGGPKSHNAFKLILKSRSRFPGTGNFGRPPFLAKKVGFLISLALIVHLFKFLQSVFNGG